MSQFIILLGMFCMVSCKSRIYNRDIQIISCGTNIDTVLYLTSKKNTLSVNVSREESNKAHRYVKIKISQVTNPEMQYLAFDVFFRTDQKKKILLGSFSLFPANNPGEFVVATRGIIIGEGQLLISMTNPDGKPLSDLVKVAVNQVNLTNQ
jgi:hypothetical protein